MQNIYWESALKLSSLPGQKNQSTNVFIKVRPYHKKVHSTKDAIEDLIKRSRLSEYTKDNKRDHDDSPDKVPDKDN